MTIEFISLEQDAKSDDQLSKIIRAGTIFFNAERESWTASRPGTGHFIEGIGSVERIPPGFWFTNLKYDETKELVRKRSATIRGDNWLRLPVEQILASWGVPNEPVEGSIKLLAHVTDRIFRLTQEALIPSIPEMNFKSIAEAAVLISRSASLATGIAQANTTGLKRGSSTDKRVLEHFRKTYQWGMFVQGRKDEEEGQIKLTFSFPRLSYAMAVTSGKVPIGGGEWDLAHRPVEKSNQEFFNEIIALGRPVIFQAGIDQGDGHVPEYADVFLGTSPGADGARTRFIPEEIIKLSEFYDMKIEKAICGQAGAGECSTGKILKALETAAGGPEAARASWSVGLAAENILTSVARKTKSDQPGESAESIWIAARDRVMMMPAIKALYDVGAILVSAHFGTIVVKCPEDQELLVSVLDAAWDQGLSLPIDDVELLEGLGVPVPSEFARFGGNDVDYPLSSVAHMRKRRTLWVLDSIQDLDPRKRADGLRKVAPS